MKFLLDENLPLSLLEIFIDLNVDCFHVKNVGLRGSPDKEIAVFAKKNNYVLVTKDLEFGNIMFYSKGSHYGLIVVRFPNNFNTLQIKNEFKKFLQDMKLSDIINSIIILEIGRYRIRRF